MIANPDEAARLAVRHAIDGRDEAINREIIRLRNASSVSELTRREGLGTLDLAMLRRAAVAYRAIGVLQREIDIADIVATNLLAKAG
jgi:NitT/TauT family transport system substrate-binding protein